jgi:acid phosphatase type 7
MLFSSLLIAQMSMALFSCRSETEEPEKVVPTESEDTGTGILHEMMAAPYIQSVDGQSAWVVWITDSGLESLVEWGTTEDLGRFTQGTTDTEGGTGHVHSVQITDLSPGTRYHYRTRTGGTLSGTSHFVTPPAADDSSPFRIVAMSDMQRDDSHPDKYEEIVHDGIISYVSDNYGADLAEEIALVLVTGDLVDNGWMYKEWLDDFFAPGHALMSKVPFYPVFGNHEASTPLFNRYLQLPDNGTVGFEEHWWTTDYSNVRIVGLDSNGTYAGETQLDWLDEVLLQSCSDNSIDFLFAQLHHPYLSELWLPGETDFTGEVIGRLEAFTEECGKPSIHFFGHTHGYSRGQSQDHRHLWVNVASAGGALDRWGTTPQADYDEFTVSQDQYGFVVIEVHPGENPSFTLERVSRGTPEVPLDNEISDSLEIRYGNSAPDRPLALEAVPVEGAPGSIVLSAGPFSDPDGDLQGASQWQLAADCDSLSSPIASVWLQWQNQWMGEDNIQGGGLLSYQATGLEASTLYCWRVRYRDRGLEWSQWSEPAEATTGG